MRLPWPTRSVNVHVIRIIINCSHSVRQRTLALCSFTVDLQGTTFLQSPFQKKDVKKINKSAKINDLITSWCGNWRCDQKESAGNSVVTWGGGRRAILSGRFQVHGKSRSDPTDRWDHVLSAMLSYSLHTVHTSLSLLELSKTN